MPGSLYERVSARGLRVGPTFGMTGEVALADQGGPQNPVHGQAVTAGQRSTLTGFEPEPPAPPEHGFVLEGSFGLPGTLAAPDQTPGPQPGPQWSHAAPFPGWAGSYGDTAAVAELNKAIAQVHGDDFGALARHQHVDGVAEVPMDHWEANTPGQSVQQPLDGQIRFMGGRDDVQGYGLRNRYGFDAAHRRRTRLQSTVVNTYLDPREQPFLGRPAAASFYPTDAVQGPGPYASYLDAGNVSADPPTAYSPPAQPATAPEPLAGGAASAGWW